MHPDYRSQPDIPIQSLSPSVPQEKGLVDFDDPVSKFLPSFAVSGKASVTLSRWDPLNELGVGGCSPG